MQLAQRLNRVVEPQTIKMAKLGRELRAKGIDIIDLSLGEPDFNTPEYICDAATTAMEEGYTKYTPVAGYLDLREAICTKLKRDNNLDYTPDQIIVSTGAKQSLANAILSIVDPGDEVIIPTPYWVTYGALAQLAEGTPVYIPCTIENDFKLTPSQLEQHISDKSKLFIFSSPCNPTGSVYSKEELAGLAEIFKRFPNCAIISDEIYEYINYSGKHESIGQFEELKDRVIVVNGMSKGFAMTGWRLGYLAGPKELVQACEKLQGQFTSGANSITERAAITALLGDMQPTFEMTKAFKERRDFLYNELKDIKGMKLNCPQGAFYLFPDVSAFFGKSDGVTTISNDEDLSMYLLYKANVSTVMGSAFGNSDCIRLSFATSMEKLQEAVKRIREALNLLQ
ncbi:MAG: pyridoxal phosphate-dependent aminotransferase [Chitinophagaceae bacterium]|nr:pyridoxal phosphate-dependent aminotransferase [Chitinophagaceae bacterium]MCB9045687.1 pyridoxal phosphate-dependent aminotransferase [Chitinophagales bacterium]